MEPAYKRLIAYWGENIGIAKEKWEVAMNILAPVVTVICVVFSMAGISLGIPET